VILLTVGYDESFQRNMDQPREDEEMEALCIISWSTHRRVRCLQDGDTERANSLYQVMEYSP
jgi:hypothetical protein